MNYEYYSLEKTSSYQSVDFSYIHHGYLRIKNTKLVKTNT